MHKKAGRNFFVSQVLMSVEEEGVVGTPSGLYRMATQIHIRATIPFSTHTAHAFATLQLADGAVADALYASRGHVHLPCFLLWDD